jgi:hypothetical protein
MVGMEIEYGSKEFLNLLLVLEQRLARGDKIELAPSSKA